MALTNKVYVNYVELGRHIREARKARSMTQEMLAERLGMTIGHLGKIERGERMINLERLAEISVLLQTPIELFIVGCVSQELGRLAPENIETEQIGQVFETLLKGRSPKTVELVLAVSNQIVKGME